MKTIEIKVPDGYKLEQVSEGKWELVKKEEITLQTIIFKSKACDILTYDGYYKGAICANTQKDINQLIVLSKLKCVAEYLNDGWQPKYDDYKWYIKYNSTNNKLKTDWFGPETCGTVVFKSEELAKKAIEICGEDLIKTALGIL